MNAKEFRKIALVGATPNPTKYGNIILKDLLGKGCFIDSDKWNF